MRASIPILSLLLLFFSCSENKKRDESGHAIQSDIETKHVNEKKSTSKQEIKTATGKLFSVIEEKKSASISDVTISPIGFSNTNENFRINDIDPLSGLFLLDLDRDGFEELYLITKGSGSGSYGTIYGYASNKDKSVSPIYTGDVPTGERGKDNDFYGYRGHDSIYSSDNSLLRKFPIYLKDDPNCCPSGGSKLLSYTLKQGEASWLLKVK